MDKETLNDTNSVIDIGSRLKAVRMENNLSQRELARKSGVTNGMISQIEGNTTSPSVASLKRILDAIPISLSAFFSDETADSKQIFFRSKELREINPVNVYRKYSGDVGDLSLRQVGGRGNLAIQMLHERYAPGSDTGDDLYQHSGDEVGIVISGHIEITVGDQVALLGPGDAYAFESRNPHRFRNPGEEDCVIVSACTPSTF
jgi:transcriptional regulator with XRE-family HTH domain